MQGFDEARVARIVRHPVKGLRGVVAARAALVPGHGLRHDRSLAIERGSVAVEDPHGWNPRETYVHVAKDGNAVRLRTALDRPEDDDAVLTLLSAGGRGAAIRLDDVGFEIDRHDADRLLAEEFSGHGITSPRLVRTGVGLWDWPDAHLSLINLATLRSLSEVSGTPVSWRRFRANIYLEGLAPWAELGLLGRRIRVGDAELEIVQATDRCRATTINPDTAESDLNVPALLAGRFGHMFCGLYARVTSGGEIGVGDTVSPESGRPRLDALDEPETSWPRTATLTRRRTETSSVTSFWLSDSLGMLADATPGQHLRVHLPGEAAPSWRCYTISALDDGLARISVKRDGRVSGALHERLDEGGSLLVTGPFGDVVLDQGESAVVLLSAGVGITPTLAMLRRLVDDARERGVRRPVRVLHTDRNTEDVPLAAELRTAIAQLPDAVLQVFVTREDPAVARAAGFHAGRPGGEDFAALLDGLAPESTTIYSCGPEAFTAHIRDVALGLGLPEDAIRSEVFFSPTAADLAPPRTPRSPGPYDVADDGDTLTWTRDDGTLLDAAERAGLAWPSGCRTGACGTCARRLVSGEVEYLVDPLYPVKRGTVLVCCSAPVGDLRLEEP